jgi:hypothetical protein
MLPSTISLPRRLGTNSFGVMGAAVSCPSFGIVVGTTGAGTGCAFDEHDDEFMSALWTF